MKTWALGLLLVLVSQISSASILPFSVCQSNNRAHTLTLQQDGKDVLLSFANKRFVKYEDISHPAEGKLKISGMEVSKIKVAGKDLHSLLRMRSLLLKLVVSSMAGRGDYDGEGDMMHADASSLLHNLDCK